MRPRLATLVAAALAAVAVHLAAAFLVRWEPLLGVDRFARTASGITGRPELARMPAGDPMRVYLGVAERAPVKGPGPKPVLDPASARKAPRIEGGWDGSYTSQAERLAAVSGLFTTGAAGADGADGADEMREPLRPTPPGSGVPSRADLWIADAAIRIDAREAARALPKRFIRDPSLRSAVTAARPKLDAARPGLGLTVDRSVPLPPPEWPDPDRPLMVPEVFVDVLAVTR